MILDGSEESCDGTLALFGEREREKENERESLFALCRAGEFFISPLELSFAHSLLLLFNYCLRDSLLLLFSWIMYL